MPNSHWGRAATCNERPSIYIRRVAAALSSSATLQTVACQASLSGEGVLQARMLEHTGRHWLPCPSRSLYFLLPCPPTPLSTWCCQNSCDPAATPLPRLALTGANPSPPGQPQEQTPVDDPHAEVEIKPQLKPRGSVTKQEGQKPSHQLHKLQIKSTSSIRPTLCLWNIQKVIESSHKRILAIG